MSNKRNKVVIERIENGYVVSTVDIYTDSVKYKYHKNKEDALRQALELLR